MNSRRFIVILNRPQNVENIGQAARAMMNTGFERLRLVGISSLPPKAFLPAVHSRNILEKAGYFMDLKEAVCDVDIVFAATAKQRKNFPVMTLFDAVEKMCRLPGESSIALLFGNERTGLTTEELKSSNFRFQIPQAQRQPSYNLASSVLITLFQLFVRMRTDSDLPEGALPISRGMQEETIRLILQRLEEVGFIHGTNRKHVTEMIFDLIGRTALTERDRNLLLALFSKGVRGES